MDASDRKNALDYISIIRDGPGRKTDIRNHAFLLKLDKDPNFTAACKQTKTSPYLLAEKVARGLVVYYDDLGNPFNTSTKKKLLPKIDYLLDELRYTSGFDCEFEQEMFLNLLSTLKTKAAPERGFESGGNSASFQRRKLVKELTLSAEDGDAIPSLITSLAAVIEPDINYTMVEKSLQRLDIDAWHKYSQKFLAEVFIPYCQFRDWANALKKQDIDSQDL